jgi:hypothetical protein
MEIEAEIRAKYNSLEKIFSDPLGKKSLRLTLIICAVLVFMCLWFLGRVLFDFDNVSVSAVYVVSLIYVGTISLVARCIKGIKQFNKIKARFGQNPDDVLQQALQHIGNPSTLREKINRELMAKNTIFNYECVITEHWLVTIPELGALGTITPLKDVVYIVKARFWDALGRRCPNIALYNSSIENVVVIYAIDPIGWYNEVEALNKVSDKLELKMPHATVIGKFDFAYRKKKLNEVINDLEAKL